MLKLKQTLSSIFILFYFFSYSTIWAQNSGNINIPAGQTTLKSLIQQIEKQSDYSFVFDNSISLNENLLLKERAKDIKIILKQAFQDREIEYEIIGKQIILKKKEGNITSAGLIKGIIKDENGEIVIGASVRIKNSSTGTITDINGGFSLSAPGNAELQISYIGYTTQTIKIDGRKNIEIVMKEASRVLDEVVVVGYGTTVKKDLTTSVTSISDKDFLKGAVNNPMQMVNGKIAGVSTTTTAASDPNSGPSIQVRGAASLEAGNSPLVIIDGMVGGNLNLISQDDIASITILKDGGAAAIYGSRGANGVILVETKKGQTGEVRINYSAYMEHDVVAARPNILSAEEFVAHSRDTDFGNRTNWYDPLINKDNFGHSHNLALSGGSENAKFRLSTTYKSKTAIDIASNREELGLRGNYDFKLWGGIAEVKGNISYKTIDAAYTNYNIFNQAIKINPTVALDNYDYFITRADEFHPVRALTDQDNGGQNEAIAADIALIVNLAKGLNTELRLSRQRQNLEKKYYLNSDAKECIIKGYKGRASLEHNDWTDTNLEWLGNYAQTIGKHNGKLMVGYSYQEQMTQGYSMENMDFISDKLLWNSIGSGTWNSATGRLGMNSWKSSEKTIAFFGRLNYDYDNQFLLSASLRYEGNSKFGDNNKWGYFPAASAAWRFSKLPVIANVKWIDDMKVRASYGVTGRSGFGRYSSLPLYMPYRKYLTNEGTWENAWGPQNNPNMNLKWERQISYNIGYDFSLLNHRLSGSLDWFTRKSKDLISDYAASVPPFIHTTVRTNVGTSVSKGIELQLNWQAVKTTNFDYSLDVIASYTKAKIKSFSNQTYSKGYIDRCWLPAPGNPGHAQRLEEGVEIGSFYGFQYAGVDDKGRILIYERSADGELTGNTKLGTDGNQDDKTYLGHGSPRYQLSMGHNFRYKNFNLSLFFRGRFDYQILNSLQLYYGLQAEPGINLLADAYGKNGHIKSTKTYCDYFLENGDYLKLDNITLGYDWKMKNKFISNIYLYGTVRNVFTITGYSGLDPDQIDVNGLEPGISSLSLYPTTRSFTFGVQINY